PVGPGRPAAGVVRWSAWTSAAAGVQPRRPDHGSGGAVLGAVFGAAAALADPGAGSGADGRHAAVRRAPAGSLLPLGAGPARPHAAHLAHGRRGELHRPVRLVTCLRGLESRSEGAGTLHRFTVQLSGAGVHRTARGAAAAGAAAVVPSGRWCADLHGAAGGDPLEALTPTQRVSGVTGLCTLLRCLYGSSMLAPRRRRRGRRSAEKSEPNPKGKKKA